MSEYLSVKYLLIPKKTSTLLKLLKIDFWGPILEGFVGELPLKILGDKIAFAAQQLYTKIRFRCFVV